MIICERCFCDTEVISVIRNKAEIGDCPLCKSKNVHIYDTDKYEDLFEAGVVDPAKVTRVALENAASIAGMLLTTECVLCDIKEETPAAPMGGGMPGGMGGMY